MEMLTEEQASAGTTGVLACSLVST